MIWIPSTAVHTCKSFLRWKKSKEREERKRGKKINVKEKKGEREGTRATKGRGDQEVS